jgi:hypothetical protein
MKRARLRPPIVASILGRFSGVVALITAAAAACSSGHGAGGTGAGVDGGVVDGEVRLDVAPRDRSGEHAYPDAAPPGALGAPLQGVAGAWTWIDFPDSRCRDGSSTGLGLNISRASPNVVVFLDQGGACFDPRLCPFNASSYGASDFGAGMSEGIFNRADPDNPLRDYSFVFIPYCTGDVHSGNNPSGSVDGVGPQQFVGYKNLDVFLARVVPTFSDAKQVLFAGSSAGGFGVLLNADHAARWFEPIPVTVLSDSGPPMPAAVVEPCLQQKWNDLWGFQRAVLGDCAGDCPYSNDYMIDDLFHFVWRYPSYRIALISSMQDATDDLFFSFGYMNCTSTSATIPGDIYEAGLVDLRNELQQAGQSSFSTYYIPGTSHIWLMTDAAFATSVAGVPLKQWVGNLLAGASVSVGP